MTASSIIVGQISAAEQASLIADHPLFVSNNVLESVQATASWRKNTGTGRANYPNWTTGSDATAAGYPTRFATDRGGQATTRPLYDPAATQWALLFDLQTGLDDLHSIDSIVLINHGLQNYSSGAVTVTFSFDDVNTFAGTNTLPGGHTNADLDLIYVSQGGIGARIVNFSIPYNAFTRLSNIRYFRVNFSVPAGSGHTPEVGELFAGRRRQMSYFPNTPYEDKGIRSEVTDFVSKSGSAKRYKRFSGQRVYEPTLESAGLDKNGLNQENEFRSMFEESDFGSKPLIYCNNPNTAPNITILGRMTEPEVKMPIYGPYDRIVSTHVVEDAPFQKKESTTSFANYASLLLTSTSPVDFTRTSGNAAGATFTSITILWWFKRTVALSTSALVPNLAISHGGATAGAGGGAGNNWMVGLFSGDGSLSPGGSNMIFLKCDGNAPTLGPHTNDWPVPGGTIVLARWHCVMITATAGSNVSRCYYDGVELTSTLFTPPTNVFFNNYNAPLTIGARDDGAFPSAPILLDEMAVFKNVVKSSADAARYANGPINLAGEAGIWFYDRWENTPNDLIGSNNQVPQNSAGYSTDHP
jgi:hypothetical protein